MKKAFRWIADNTLIALALVTVAAVTTATYQVREITANDYEILTRLYPKAKPELKKLVRDSFADGKIIRWNYVTIFTAALNDRGVIGWSGDDGTIEAQREKLRQVIAQDTTNG